MKSTGDIVRERYQRHIQGAPKVTRAVALFALQMACADMEEVWRDEYECIRHRGSVLLDEKYELQRQLEQLQRVYVAEIALADALEAECIHLRTMISEYSAPTGASTAQYAPAALSTSSTAAPMPAEQGESIDEREEIGEAAPSAPTSQPKRRRGRPAAPKPAGSEGVGEITGLDPIDWSAVLVGPSLTSKQIADLDSGKNTWRRLPRELQRTMIMTVAETIHNQIGDISQKLFDSHKPQWMTSVSSWTVTNGILWNDVLTTLDRRPDRRRLALKIGQNATSG